MESNQFKLGMKYRYKNGALLESRRALGLSAKDTAQGIGLSYGYYNAIENLQAFPADTVQKKICNFFGLLREDVFPAELLRLAKGKQFTGSKFITAPITFERLETLHTKQLISTDDTLEQVEQEETNAAIRFNLNRSNLTLKEKDIFKRRFGFNGEAQSLEEVAEHFNVCRERIRQIEARAIRKLKHPVIKERLENYL